MVAMLVYSNEKKEIVGIQQISKDLVAHLSEESLEMTTLSSLDEVEKIFTQRPVINISCYDVTQAGSIDVLGNARKEYKDMRLMLIADTTMSPLDYVRPDILASALMLRPFSPPYFREKMKDMLIEYFDSNSETDADNVLIIDSKDGKIRVPYNQIFYVEARNKKIYIRLKNKELAMNDSLEKLEERLPDTFARCHRSFVVNKFYIEKVQLSKSEIQLSHGIYVPLSRSYKPLFK